MIKDASLINIRVYHGALIIPHKVAKHPLYLSHTKNDSGNNLKNYRRNLFKTTKMELYHQQNLCLS